MPDNVVRTVLVTINTARWLLVSLWCFIGVLVLWAPWPYAGGAALFATFLHLSALDERDEGDGELYEGEKR